MGLFPKSRYEKQCEEFERQSAEAQCQLDTSRAQYEENERLIQLSRAQHEDNKQLLELSRELARAQKLHQAEAHGQLLETARLLESGPENARRAGELLDRWEELAQRLNSLLSRWERHDGPDPLPSPSDEGQPDPVRPRGGDV